MSLAQRVRDFRYSKGWGPDELANRAEISRTALYQIESGRTELPRAGTLRRIAVALDVPMEELLGHDEEPQTSAFPDPAPARRGGRLHYNHWVPSEGGPLSIPVTANGKGVPGPDDSRFTVEHPVTRSNPSHEAVYVREGELMSKLHDLIHSPMGESVAKLIEELHGLIPRNRGTL